MNYIEQGEENKEVIILLHGGGLSYWNYNKVIDKLKDTYHVILPILDGHNGSSNNFISISDNAKRVIEFIDKKFNGKVLLIGGLSLGAQIALEILSLRKDIAKYALIESALVIPSKLVASLLEPSINSCYSLISNRYFAKLQFKSLKIRNDLFEDYYKDTCGITKVNMISFLKENAIYTLKDSIEECESKVFIYIGSKERQVIKKSAKIINNKIKNSQLVVLDKLYHGEFSINYSDKYTQTILNIVNDNL